MPQSNVRPTSYMRYRVLVNHDAQCLQVGDFVEFTGSSLMVAEITRKQGQKFVRLEDGYTFNAARANLTNLTILRPLAKFRAFRSETSKPVVNEWRKDEVKKNQDDRKKKGSRK